LGVSPAKAQRRKGAKKDEELTGFFFFAPLRLCGRLFLNLLSKTIFGALIGLIVATAIPYGTAEPWWKAAFICAVFAICIAAIVEWLISGADRIDGAPLLLPMLALSAL